MVFRNKVDEHGIVIRNKARLVAKGYNQEKISGNPDRWESFMCEKSGQGL